MTNKIYRYDMSAITHVGNRVKVSLHNYDTDEDYNLDFTQEDLRKFFILLSLYLETGDFSLDEYDMEFHVESEVKNENIQTEN